MADNFTYKNAGGSTETGGADEITDGTLGTVKVPYVKLMGGAINDTEKVGGDAANGLDVDVTRLPALAAGTNNIGDVDVLSLPALPAGANNIGDVDVLTLPALPAGTNNIGDVDVLTLPALPAGNNNIGDVDVATLPALPAGTNNIGDVDVLSLPAGAGDGAILDGVSAAIKATVLDYTNSNPLAVRLTDTNGDYVAAGGGGGAGTEYTEDAAAAANPVGGMLIGRRKDTLSAAEVSADGDNIALNATDKGQLHVKLADTVIVNGSGVTQPVSAASLPLPTGASTAAKQPALGTAGSASADVISVQGIASMTALKVDGSAVTQPVSAASLPLPTGAATAAKQPALGTAGSASADVITVQGVASMTALKVDASATTQPVSGTVTANAGTNLNTSALALESGGNLATIAGAIRAEDVASADGHTGIPGLAVRKATPGNTSGTDGDYEMLQMSAGRLWASATIDAALPAGTNAIGKLAANSGVDIGDVDVASVAGTVTVAGNVAHDAADSGNPQKIGAKVETSPKGITLAADGDRTDLYADADGILIVKLNTAFADIISERVTDTGGTSTAFSNFTAVANVKNYVTAITVYNSSATPGFIDFRSGTGGAVLWTMPLPAGGGSVIANSMPLFATAANTALAYDVSGALSTIYISISGFQSKI